MMHYTLTENFPLASSQEVPERSALMEPIKLPYTMDQMKSFSATERWWNLWKLIPRDQECRSRHYVKRTDWLSAVTSDDQPCSIKARYINPASLEGPRVDWKAE